MILVDPAVAERHRNDGLWGKATLDGLLARAASERPLDVALVDEARELHSSGLLSRMMSWQDLDERVSALAATLLDAGLRQDDVLGIQLAGSAEAMLAHLAAIRAGLIPAALPLHWRRSDLTVAAGKLGAKALVTAASIGGVPHADIMREVAFDTLSVRHVFAFGPDVPDGVESLDHTVSGLASTEGGYGAPRAGNPADHVASVTFFSHGDVVPLARSHNQMLSGGAMVAVGARLTADATLATMLAPGSYAGLCCGLVAWLLARCKLLLLAPASAIETGNLLTRHDATHMVIPARLADALSPETTGADHTPIRLWTDPVALETAAPDEGKHGIDVISFADLALWADEAGDPLAFPTMMSDSNDAASLQARLFLSRMQGLVHRAGSASAPGALLRGGLLVGGPQVPVMAFPGCEDADPGIDRDGFRATGLRCRLVQTRPPRARLASFSREIWLNGNIPLNASMLDELYRDLPGVADAAAIPLPDPVLGTRIAVALVPSGEEPPSLEELHGELRARGASASCLPERFFVMSEIPRAHDGTVHRDALESRCAA